MLNKIDHVGIATAGIKEALSFWTAGLNLECVHEESVPSQQVNTAFLPVGETNVELLEGTSPESPIAKFVEKRGAGIHHICFEVPDIAVALERLKSCGFQLIDEKPRIGAHGRLVAFVHPKSSGGVLIELCQKVEVLK